MKNSISIILGYQARRQDSVTGGGGHKEIWGGARELDLREFESVDQTKKVKTKKRSSIQKFPQILVIISKIVRFSTNSEVKTKQNKKQKKVFCSKISAILVFISKFLRFSTNSKVKTKK